MTDPSVPSPKPSNPQLRLAGIGAGLAAYAAALLLASTQVADDQYAVLGYAIWSVVAGLALVLVGGGLLISPRTRAFGTGVLIAAAIGALIGGGVCIRIFSGT